MDVLAHCLQFNVTTDKPLPHPFWFRETACRAYFQRFRRQPNVGSNCLSQHFCGGRSVGWLLGHQLHDRLLNIRRAYDLFEEARDLLGQGDLEGGLQKVELARQLKPGDPQLAFWAGLALGNAGRDEEARRLLDEAFSISEGWRELARRLRDIGFYSGDPNLIEP